MQPRLKKSKLLKRKRRIFPRLRKKRSVEMNKRPKRKVKRISVNEQIAASHTQGYQAGYSDALHSAKYLHGEAEQRRHEEGYKKGFYEGGDGLVDLCLPDSDILPEISINQIVAAGVEQMRPHLHRMLGAPELAEQIIQALDQHTPLSVVRLGDGELLTLSQEVVMSVDQVGREGPFLSYAGVHIPDLEARDQLLQAVKLADVVGIPKLRLPNFQPLAFAVLQAHGLDYRQMKLTLSTVNYALYLEGYLPEILAGGRVLLVGNSAPALSQVLSKSGVHVVDAIAPVQGMKDIPRVMSEIKERDFDLALVGAGIPAVVIAQRIAAEFGKVAIDFGHLADSMCKGEAPI